MDKMKIYIGFNEETERIVLREFIKTIRLPEVEALDKLIENRSSGYIDCIKQEKYHKQPNELAYEAEIFRMRYFNFDDYQKNCEDYSEEIALDESLDHIFFALLERY